MALKCHEHESSAHEDDYRVKKIHRRSTSINLIQSGNNNNINNKEGMSSLSNSLNPNNNTGNSKENGTSSALNMVPYHSTNPRKVPLEVISITRKLGLALFNMGLLQSASIHLLSALKQLNIELPPIQPSSGSKPVKLNRLAKPPRQDSLTKFLTASLDPLEKREATLCLVL